jgi:hypothetical protein
MFVLRLGMASLCLWLVTLAGATQAASISKSPPGVASSVTSVSEETPPGWTPGQRPELPSQPGLSGSGDPGPRDFLRLLNVDESHFEKLVDGEPVGLDEQEVLANLMYVVRRIDGEFAEFADRWTKRSGDFGWDDLAKASAARRGQFFRLTGHVTRVTAEFPLPELAERLDLRSFYRCQCELGEQRSPFVVYAIEVPKAWPLDQPIREPISVQGMYVKLSGGGITRPDTPTFAALRVAWHPDNLLGRLGLDVGLLEGISHNTKLHTLADRDAFYQLLAGAGRLPAAEIDGAARRALETLRGAAAQTAAAPPDMAAGFSIPKILEHAKQVETLRRQRQDVEQLGALADRVLALKRQEPYAQTPMERAALASDLSEELEKVKLKARAVNVPADVMANLADLNAWIEERLADAQQKLNTSGRSPYSQGQPMIFEGTARRALRVRVDEPALQERYGLDHYYEVILFVDLGRVYKLEASNLRIDDAPVHVCLRELPPEMPLGDNIHEQVQVSGVFFKVFPYMPELAEQSGTDERHLAPLLIGRELTWIRGERRSHFQFAIIAAALFLVVLGGIALWSWRTRRADALARAKLLRAQSQAGEGGSLNELKLD